MIFPKNRREAATSDLILILALIRVIVKMMNGVIVKSTMIMQN